METESKQEDTSPDPVLIDLDRGVKTIETPYNRGYTSDTKSTRKPKKVPYKMGKKKKDELSDSTGKTQLPEKQRKIVAYVLKKKKKSFKRKRTCTFFTCIT
ncbi:unnamed protein product [Brassica rapa]|uniref:Uncharacterized protein n=2 Tax=Brassica TaxID=3705 RepID=A0A8D9GN48_BRACM|nr:unnamed protein product [Brassica napus]CAG7883846.1 unnamed protein product [Brassica rapa]